MGRMYNWLFKVLILKLLDRKNHPTRRNSDTIKSRPRLRWEMRVLGTQHHLTLILDKYRTTLRSNQDERESQAVTSLLTPLYSAIVYIGTVYKRIVFKLIELSTVYFWYHSAAY